MCGDGWWLQPQFERKGLRMMMTLPNEHGDGERRSTETKSYLPANDVYNVRRQEGGRSGGG